MGEKRLFISIGCLLVAGSVLAGCGGNGPGGQLAGPGDVVPSVRLSKLAVGLLQNGSAIADPREIEGNVLWLDGSDVDGDFNSGGSFADGARWIDKSTANTADAVQANADNQPSVVPDGLNGLSVVRFDGNDIMDVDSEAFGMLNNVSGATLFGLVKTGVTSGQRVFMISTGDRSQASRAGLNLFDQFSTSIGGTGSFSLAGRRLDEEGFQRVNGGRVVLGEFDHYAGVFDYANGRITLFVNGGEETRADNFQTPGRTSPTNSLNIRLGADAALNNLRGVFRGDIAELIVYNRALEAEERRGVEAYLEAKWFSDGRMRTEPGVRRVAIADVTVTQDGEPVDGVEVAFARSVSGRPVDYSWTGTTDPNGQTRVEIASDRTVSGYYLVKATDLASGEVVGRWGSVPINRDRVLLSLPIGEPAGAHSRTFPKAGEVAPVPGEFVFTEGPAADPEGNVYFSDVRASLIYKLDTEGNLSTFLENTQGTNGLMYDAVRNRLIGAQGGARQIIAVSIPGGEIEVLADSTSGAVFGPPNDLVVDLQGGVYFSAFQGGGGGGRGGAGGGRGGGGRGGGGAGGGQNLPGPGAGKQAVQEILGIFYLAPDGSVTQLLAQVADDIPRANGVILSPDESTLYVLLTGRPAIIAYPVQSPGVIGPGREISLEDPGDGLSIDTEGNLYITQTQQTAVDFYSPDGLKLGRISLPFRPTNCTFGGKDMRTLFITARTAVYTVRMNKRGHRFTVAP